MWKRLYTLDLLKPCQGLATSISQPCCSGLGCYEPLGLSSKMGVLRLELPGLIVATPGA